MSYFLSFIILLGFFLLITGVRIVRQQTAVIVETFGRYSRTLSPGLNFIIPVVERVAARMDLRVQEIKAAVEIKTSDNAFVNLPVAIMVRVEEMKADDAYYKLAHPKEQVKTWVLNSLRSATAGMKLADLFTDRSTLEQAVNDALTTKMSAYGYVIVSVLVDQPSVSDEVQKSFNRVVASQREKEAAEQEAEAKKIRVVGEARAESESQKLRAQGIADARKILSQSLTEAVKAAKDSGINEHDMTHLLLETNRLETIKHASEHGRLVIMDVRSPGAAPNIVLPQT